jgi:WD40 repeat protein
MKTFGTLFVLIFLSVNLSFAQDMAIKTFVGHEAAVRSVAIDKDGKYIASVSEDMTIRLWDYNTNELLKTEKLAYPLYHVTFSKDGRYIAIAGGTLAPLFKAELRIYEVPSLSLVKSFTGHKQRVNTVCFSPDGKYIVSGSSDNNVIVWDVASGNAYRTFTAAHKKGVNCVDYSPDGKFVISGGSEDKSAILWNVLNNQKVNTFTGHTLAINAISFSPDGKNFCTGSADNTIKIWEIATSKVLFTIGGANKQISDVRYSPDGKYIVSASADNNVRQYNAKDSKQLQIFKGHTKAVHSAYVTADNQYIISGSVDKLVKVWEMVK